MTIYDGVELTLQTQGRPGDSRDRFSSSLTGTASAAADAPGVIATLSRGAVRRVTGAGVVAHKERIAVEAGRRYAVRWMASRQTDPTDPSGDTVRFGIQWLTGAKASNGQLTDGSLDTVLSVSDGITTNEIVVASAAADGVDFVWPANTAYMVPFVQTYGSDGVTNIDVIEWDDVTEFVGAFMKSTDDTDDITVGANNKFATAAEKTKVGYLTVTQPVNLDAMEAALDDKVAFNGRSSRPGDAPLSYSTVLTAGDEAAIAPLTDADTVADDNGRVVRITGVGLVAQRSLFPIEEGRVYKLRSVVRRRVNTGDPANDAVRVAIAWYDQNKIRLAGGGASTVVQDITDLVTGVRRQVVGTFSRSSGVGADIVAPANARYARAYVETFGSPVPQTDVEVIDTIDTTDLDAWSPDVSVFDGRLVVLEGYDAGARLTALESAVGTPSMVTFATIADAEAATIGASPDQVEVLNGAAVGDRRGGIYKRAVSEPTHDRKFTSLDGAWWEYVGPRPILIFSSGQSNFEVRPAYDWTPPPNLKIWNWAHQSLVPGTAFVDVSDTVIGADIAFAARIAEENPGQDVRLVSLAWGGQDISKWIGGYDYTWSTDTTETDPGTGVVKGNNATLASITELYMHEEDGWGVNKITQIANISAGRVLRISDVSSPANFIEFTVSGSAVDNGDWHSIPGSVTGVNGTLSGSVKALINPDMSAIIGDNLPAALAAAGVSSPSIFLWFQGEANSAFPERYPADYEDMIALFEQEGWIAPVTPQVIFGIVSTAVNGAVHRDPFTLVQQRIVQADPENRMWVYHNLGASFWDGTLVHMTADGYWRYGRMAANAFLSSVGRNVGAGMVVNPVTGASSFPAMVGFGGTHAPLHDLHLRHTGATVSSIVAEGESHVSFRVARFSGDGVGPVIETRKYRGTVSSPAPVSYNDQIMAIHAYGYSGSVPQMSAAIRANVIAASPSGSDMETRISFLMCGPGAVALTDMFRFDVANGFQMGGGNIVIDGERNFRLRSYTVAGLPSAFPANRMIYVSDETGGAVPAFSDGANWRRVTDRAIVS